MDEAGNRSAQLDLYLPPDKFKDKGVRPFIVYVHGGKWLSNSANDTTAYDDWPEALASLAAKGYVVAVIGNQPAEETTFPAAIHEVKEAVRWMRAHAGEYNIDKNRGLIWGASAGGHLAALAATTCGVALQGTQASGTTQNPTGTSESDCLQAAVVWYGVSDFTSLGDSKEAMRFLGCTSNDEHCAELRRLASPVTHVSEKAPPFLIVHGTRDQTAPVEQAKELYATLAARNAPAELLLMQGVDHGFIGQTPKATHDTARQAWTATVDFIDRTIGNK